MPQTAPLLRQVKASAGSGKTHALTRAYLELLRSSQVGPGGRDPDGEGRPACSRTRESGHAWPEILAVTFTNKAAAEMKERVLDALKAAALNQADQDPAPGFSPAQAAAALEAILRRYHRLNIRTIDSLLNLILKLFALDEGISPDFELAFDQDTVYEPVFARFLAACETEGQERALFNAALSSMVLQENKRGFDLSEAIRKRLFALITFVRGDGRDFEDDPAVLAAELAGPYARFREAATNLNAQVHLLGLPLNANFTKYLQRCLDAALFDGPPKSALADKPDLTHGVLKEGKAKVTDQADAAYARLKEAHAAYALAQAPIKGAWLLAPCLRMAKALLSGVREHEAARGVVVGSALAAQAGRRLARDEGVSEAFCRMGARLAHLLIDEFQDTSREQWTALFPLAEECLAKGGSLFYVGDVKQAIYGWRGGDSALFEAVLASPLARLAPPEREELPHNWRSRRAVVEFNNDFFSSLEHPATAGELARRLLPEAPQECVLDLADGLVQAFAGCTQSLPAGEAGGRDREGGYVRLERLPGLDPDPAAEACEQMEYRVREILSRRPARDVAVLVRANEQAALACDQLLSAGIPVITESSLRLADHPVVRRLAAFLAFLDFPLDDLALASFVSGPELFGAEAGILSEDIQDWLCRRGPGPAYKSFRQEFPAAWDRLIDPFFRKAGLMGVYDLVREAVRVFRVLQRRPFDELYVRRFLEVVCLAERSGRGSPAAFLEYWEESGGEEKVPLPQGLNAVRIMTIHKAKGLQFPVVVVPFHGFKARPEADFHVMEAGDKPLITSMLKNLGQPYAASLGRAAREALNTLYVAWTRAEDELYGFLPADLGQEAPAAQPALAACALILGQELQERGMVERGIPPRAEPDLFASPPQPEPLDLAPAPDEPAELMAWLPRLRVFRHSLHTSGHQERLRGEAAHKALELLRCTDTDAARAMARAVTGALDFFPGLTPRRQELSAQLADMLAWLLAQPDLPGFLARGRAEAEIMDQEGRFHRADLLVEDPDRVTVLEYKTGAAQPEHKAQLARYLGLLAARRAPDARPVRGLLVYLDERRIETVALGQAGPDSGPASGPGTASGPGSLPGSEARP